MARSVRARRNVNSSAASERTLRSGATTRIAGRATVLSPSSSLCHSPCSQASSVAPSMPSTAATSSDWKDSRRSSPSVTTGQPTSSWRWSASMTARSSSALKPASSTRPAAWASRASSRPCGRSSEPTWSARAVRGGIIESMEIAVRIVLVSGSLRAGSGNSAVVRTAAAVAPAGVEGVVLNGMGDLPHFNPDDDLDPLPGPVAALRTAIGAGDAVMFCTPEYAGALPGSFKNLLDWTVGGAEMYRRPVAFINASGIAAPTGGADAHDSLRKVLSYVGAEIVEPACARIPVPRDAVGPDGLIADPALREAIAGALGALAGHVRRRPADGDELL